MRVAADRALSQKTTFRFLKKKFCCRLQPIFYNRAAPKISAKQKCEQMMELDGVREHRRSMSAFARGIVSGFVFPRRGLG
jgi:hypothetical protein